MADIEPWEKQPGESAKAFEAFVVYRDMPSRSIRKVARKLSKSAQAITKWYHAFSWKDRADAWDREQDRIVREAHIKEILESRKRQADLAREMMDKASDALKVMIPEKMKAIDVAKMVEVAAKMEKLALGDVTDVVEERDGGTVEPAVQFYIPSNGRDE